MEISDLRREYSLKEFDLPQANDNPLQQFETWFQEALQSDLPEPNAMTLATASAQGKPSARVVLLKGLEDGGFVFFTNYQSEKGRHLAENPQACLNFFWIELERQVRIEGSIEKIAPEASDAYFASRPFASQLGAWTSPQSEPISGREELSARFKEVSEKYSEGQVPRPAHWGGYVLKPSKIEFWQGRPSRLHDRIVYALQADNTWKKYRVAP